ncbi:hypothetical protein BJ138DRAFT_995653 [Hygrophoropsis aurantiaca]|uniref:Uncharacterized protein n=1 Tax=Hygrophoropsis aurantiaca TaxID=72124 RepID=A0ACB8AT03_9AGAM|nr:hypothetical protein BJ138DRAFT_995653 [Hygrophoropsis aurantiaca]
MDASVRAAIAAEDNLSTPAQAPRRTLRRRSSRLSQWLQELQNQSSAQSTVVDLSGDADADNSGCNPYLAYPHLSLAAVRPSFDDAGSMHSYVVVDDDEMQDYLSSQLTTHAKISHDPPALTHTSTPRSTVRMTATPPSARNLQFSLRSVSPSVVSSASQSPSRLSMFQRASRGNSNSGLGKERQHNRSSSWQTSQPGSSSHVELPSAPSGSSTWRWRPSVLGHFSSASVPDTYLKPPESHPNPSRPSISSTNTYSSRTTPTTTTIYDEGDSPNPPSTPQKSSPFLGSLRSHTRSHKATSAQSLVKTDLGSTSSPTLWSMPNSVSHLPTPPRTPSSLARKASTIRLPFTKTKPAQHGGVSHIHIEERDPSQPHVVFSGKNNAPRVSLSSIGSQSRSKKKKLVISGIRMNDTARLEAAQRWCQSFGEVDQITRMPNGDLHVNFHKAEVADTVCRVRAKVQIPGVGSVHLSWYTGNKRP